MSGRWSVHPLVRTLFLLTLLCLPALVPMLGVPFWQSHDALHHIFRFASFDETLRSGVLLPRWADQLGFGYGFPVTYYYAPLSYYVAELFHILGAGFLDSLKLTYALGAVLSALGMYRLARDWLSAPAALLAAAAYVYYPYHIADIYMRGTLSEFLALSLLPLIVWTTTCAVRKGAFSRKFVYALLASVLLAALVLTHNLSAFLFIPVLGLLGCLLYASREPRRSARVLLWLGGISAAALVFSAFYWLPALSEVGWIRAGQVSGGVDDMASLLTPLTQFVRFTFAQPYNGGADASLQHPLNLLIVVLSLLAVVVCFAQRAQFTPSQRRAWLAWLTIALLMLFLMLDISAPLWSSLRVLAFVQFPYRLHAILSLAVATLIGFGAEALAPWLPVNHSLPGRAVLPQARTRRSQPAGVLRLTIHVSRYLLPALSVAVVLLLISSSLVNLPITPQTLPGHSEPITEAEINVSGMSEYDYQTALWARLYGGVWLLEYLPAWLTEAREEFFLPAPGSGLQQETTATGAEVEVVRYRAQQRVLRVRSGQPFQLSFHTFYFPAWQVRVDDQAVRTFPAGPLGLVAADIPAGDHQVSLAFEGTPMQRAGEWLSLAAAASLLVLGLLRAQHRQLWLSSLLLVLTGVLGWRSFDPSRAFATGTRAANDPQPVFATFDRQLNLLGYQVSAAVVHPGDVVDVALYWFAQQTPAENFKVFVHLDASAPLQGSSSASRAGQVDMQPGSNFSPTTRWQRGEVVADRYRLKIAADAAPGTYELYTGIYRPQPLRNLPVVSANAVPGDRVRLGTLTVTAQ